MYIDEGKNRYKNRNANRPNFHKGSRPHIPSQTIGNTKVQINSESAIQELKNLANKYRNINDPRGFLTDLRNALGIPYSKGASKYGVITIPKEDGTELVVSLRITNHQANADTYIEHNANYEYNLSIVIKKKRRKNTFIPNDNVVLDEFVYYGNNLQKVESPLSKIAEGLIEYLTTGKYEDKTGVALPNVSPQPNANNQEKLNCNRNMKKNTVKLTESQLHRVIKESVKKVLKEGSITSNAGTTLINCEREARSVLNGIKNEFTKVYSLVQDTDENGFHDAISAFRDLMNKFTYHEYEMQIHNAYKPIIDAFIDNNQANGENYSEPEDWHERNEHGDFDNY